MKITLLLCLVHGLLFCAAISIDAQIGENTVYGVGLPAQYGCFAANDLPTVRQINPASSPLIPTLATFTGGRTVGVLSPCFDTNGVRMGSYATSHRTPAGTIIPGLGNKITINFHKPVEFRRIGIEGKWPQRIRVIVDGASTEVDMENYQGSGTGWALVGDPRPGALEGKRFSSITVSSDDPDWRFGIYSITYGSPDSGEEPPPRNACTWATQTRPSGEDHFPTPERPTHGWTMHSEISDARKREPGQAYYLRFLTPSSVNGGLRFFFWSFYGKA